MPSDVLGAVSSVHQRERPGGVLASWLAQRAPHRTGVGFNGIFEPAGRFAQACKAKVVCVPPPVVHS